MAFIDSNSIIFYLIIIFVAVGNLREKEKKAPKLQSVIIFPFLMLIITFPLISNELNSIVNIILLSLGFIVGLFIGIIRGKFSDIRVNDNGRMIIKGNILGVAIWLVIIVLKIVSETILTGYVGLNLLISVFLLITIGTIIARKIYIYWAFSKL